MLFRYNHDIFPRTYVELLRGHQSLFIFTITAGTGTCRPGSRSRGGPRPPRQSGGGQRPPRPPPPRDPRGGPRRRRGGGGGRACAACRPARAGGAARGAEGAVGAVRSSSGVPAPAPSLARSPAASATCCSARWRPPSRRRPPDTRPATGLDLDCCNGRRRPRPRSIIAHKAKK